MTNENLIVDVTDEFVEHNGERSVQGMCTLHSLWFYHPVQQWVQCSRYVYTTLAVVLSSSTAVGAVLKVCVHYTRCGFIIQYSMQDLHPPSSALWV